MFITVENLTLQLLLVHGKSAVAKSHILQCLPSLNQGRTQKWRINRSQTRLIQLFYVIYKFPKLTMM